MADHDTSTRAIYLLRTREEREKADVEAPSTGYKVSLLANQAALPEEWRILLEPTLLKSEILNIKHQQR
jgi:hypothetical protein